MKKADKRTITTIAVVVAAIAVVIVVVSAIYNARSSKEGYRRGGWWRRYRGRPSFGWNYWGNPYWRRTQSWLTSWPPYLYGRPTYLSTQRCIVSNEASDCIPAFPVKVGTDSTGDGVKDSWTCCR